MSAKSPNPKDQRVLRTDRRLREAFVSLVRERGYPAVTIREVVQRAGVGRSTFYTHYGDLDELHGRWLEDFSPRSGGDRPLLDFARTFLEHAHTQRRYWRDTARAEHGVKFRRRFRRNLLALAREEAKRIVPARNPAVIEAVSRWLAGAYAEVLFWWIDAPADLSPDLINGVLQRLTACVPDMGRKHAIPLELGARSKVKGVRLPATMPVFRSAK